MDIAKFQSEKDGCNGREIPAIVNVEVNVVQADDDISAIALQRNRGKSKSFWLLVYSLLSVSSIAAVLR